MSASLPSSPSTPPSSDPAYRHHQPGPLPSIQACLPHRDPPLPQGVSQLTGPKHGPTPTPPQSAFPQRHRLSPCPNKLARGGSGGHNPVKTLSSPKMAPPFPLVGTEASLGCPSPLPLPQVHLGSESQGSGRQPGVVMGRSPGLGTLPSHQQESSPAHHADPSKGGSSCPMENSDLRSPDQFPTLGWLVP